MGSKWSQALSLDIIFETITQSRPVYLEQILTITKFNFLSFSAQGSFGPQITQITRIKI